MERIRAYCDLPPEPAWEIQPGAPSGWPSAGRIVFKDVVLRYRPDIPPALRGLSFIVEPAQRLGIVGRTGAGKSTIAAALLRLRELEAGSITLDGLDLATLGLSDVRRGVCAIPQEPLLLTGSVRVNLDPQGLSTDEQVWTALRAVRMEAPVLGLPGGLEAPVADGGGNFSTGERQLLCFARALLRTPRVLLLDEATASVDEPSDNAIQLALRTSFAHVTILTIAHRLATVMDYDKILVLAAGQALEFGAPAELLAQQGALAALVDSVGAATAAHLRRSATAASRTDLVAAAVDA